MQTPSPPYPVLQGMLIQHAVSIRKCPSQDTYGRIRANVCYVEAFARVLTLDLCASDGEASAGHDGKVGSGVTTGGSIVSPDSHDEDN